MLDEEKKTVGRMFFTLYICYLFDKQYKINENIFLFSFKQYSSRR